MFSKHAYAIQTWLRMASILVRGRKRDIAKTKGVPVRLLRMASILVRGRKLVLVVEGNDGRGPQNGLNPREGTETSCIHSQWWGAGAQNGLNPREGTETQ